MNDYIVRATAADAQVRAFACSTRDLVEAARRAHDTSPVVTAALGRLLSAGVMMGSMLKGKRDLITLQVKGDGPVVTTTQVLKSTLLFVMFTLSPSFSSMNRVMFLITLFADISLPTMMIQSSAYHTKLSPLFSISLSSSFNMIFDSNGERFPPCGVPTIESLYLSSIMIPLARYFLTIEITSPSLIVRPIMVIRLS